MAQIKVWRRRVCGERCRKLGLQTKKKRWFEGIADRPRVNNKARVKKSAKRMSFVIASCGHIGRRL